MANEYESQGREPMKSITVLKSCLQSHDEVLAAYLFGSAARREFVQNDLDILVLLCPGTDPFQAYVDLTHNLSKTLRIREKHIDLLFFDLEAADPTVLYRAVNEGILLKNKDPLLLDDRIDALSRYFLENEPLFRNAKQLRRERLEGFCAK